jgi:transposase
MSGTREVEITAGNLEALKSEIEKAKKRFGMTGEVIVRSCYEAGREGFWLHRAMKGMGIENIVVEPASIEVNRRQRRAKTDRMDLGKLIRQLIRHWRDEEKVWSVLRVPSEEAEQERQLHRGMEVLKQERKQHRTRIQSLLFTQGIDVKVGKNFPAHVDRLRCRWNAQPLPEPLKKRVLQEYERLKLAEEQIRMLTRQQTQQVKAADSGASNEQVQLLMKLVGIGMTSAWIFVKELFWRDFQNRREVAGAIGITPTPYDSGDRVHEQGISRSGNGRVRATAVEVAWCWLRLQPTSKLSQWYRQRFAKGGPRARRVGIVAMARRLMVDLWRYLETGVVPEGAKLKA